MPEPRKAAYKRLASDPDLWFDYWLADRLKKTVGEIREMPNEEWLYWSMFHGMRVQQEQLELKAVRRGKGR